jgi:hypothetical protein
LWDTKTGRRVTRLDRNSFQFVAEGRWVTAIERGSTVVVLSADDGREIARLSHPGLGPLDLVLDVFSPTGRRVVTRVERDLGLRCDFHTWEVGTWRKLPGVIALNKPQGTDLYKPPSVYDLSDDLFAISHYRSTVVCRPGQPEPLARLSFRLKDIHVLSDTLLNSDGMVIDLRTGQRLAPPPGRRFHPALARFAPDGRFFGRTWRNHISITDVLTDKRLATEEDLWTFDQWVRLAFLPNTGLVGIDPNGQEGSREYRPKIRIVPSAPPDVRPEVLELWAQVAVRGEIGPDGNFVKWDEPTWERKRQELAAHPAPSPDFPFPGHVAHDRLHWLRSEFDDADDRSDRRPLARELLRRAEALGDRAEAVRWREWLRRNDREPAPPPRPAK